MNDDRILEPREMEDIRSKTSQRHTRGWLTVCGDARMLIPWMAFAIVADTLRLKVLGRGDLLQEAALGLAVLFGIGSSRLVHPGYGRSRVNTTPVIHSLPQLRFTTILSVLAALSMVAGWVLGVWAGGMRPSIGFDESATMLAQTARHLEWLWWGTAAGLVFVVAAAIAQPWSLYFETTATVCVLAVEACTLFLFLYLHNTFAALGVILLHLTAANTLWSTDLWRDEPPDADSDHDERWLEHHQGNV